MNVVQFPKKIFAQWGALAQELVSALKLLGASNAEAKEITARLQLKWAEHGPLPVVKGLRSVSASPADGQGSEAEPASSQSARQTCAYWKSQEARTLLELAKHEYRQGPAQ